MTSTTRRQVGGLALAGLGMGRTAHAQTSPDRPLRWIVGYPPGGATDIVARILAAHLTNGLNQTVVVDNRPGAGTIVAADALVKSRPDGHTVMTVDTGTLVYNKALYRRLPYDPSRDFKLVMAYARFHFLLVVAEDVPARTPRELVDLCRRQPGSVTFASPGIGSPHHLALERLQRSAGFTATHVPYRGAAPALNDLTAGTVQAMVLDYASGQAHVAAGRIRALAVTSQARLAQLPAVPTIAEAGFPGNETLTFHGVVVPAGTPDARAEALGAAIAAATASDEARQRFRELGAEPMQAPPAEFERLVEAENATWLPLIRALNISLDT